MQLQHLKAAAAVSRSSETLEEAKLVEKTAAYLPLLQLLLAAVFPLLLK